MSRRLRVAPAAEAELEEAADWYEERDPLLRLAFLEAIRDTIDRVLEAPNSGLAVPGMLEDRSVRRVLARTYPYAVVYVVEPHEVRIVAFAHLHRRPGYWTGRL